MKHGPWQLALISSFSFVVVFFYFIQTAPFSPFAIKESSAQVSTAIQFDHAYVAPDKQFLVSIPLYWVGHGDSVTNLNLSTTTYVNMESNLAEGSRVTRWIYVEASDLLGIFNVPDALSGKVQNEEFINFYLQQVRKGSISLNVISVKPISTTLAGSGYEVVYEYLTPNREVFQNIERFFFKGGKVFHLQGGYYTGEPQYRSIIMATFDTFRILP